MSKEIKRQAIKTILQEMSDNALPIHQIALKAFQEDWDEQKVQEEMIKAMSPEMLSKNFDYFTDRIMGVFED